MKTMLLKVLPLAVALSVGGLGTASAQLWDDPWGNQPYDEQQFWNPFDWFENGTAEAATDQWDYGYQWADNEWYSEEGYGAADEGFGYDYGYGTDTFEGGLGRDWGGGWNDDFGYDTNGLFE